MNLTEREKELMIEALEYQRDAYKEDVDMWNRICKWEMEKQCENRVAELEALIEKVKAI